MDKLFLIFFFFFQSFFIASTYASDDTKNLFLNELNDLYKKYGNSPVELHNPSPEIENNTERNQIISKYEWSLPKLWIGLQTICYNALDLDKGLPFDDMIDRNLTQNKPITPKNLLDFFTPLLSKEEFTFQNGDIVFILSHLRSSFIFAYILDSAYSHSDMIWINPKTKIPMVIMSSPVENRIVPLSEYLCGYFEHLNSFAIYRYNKESDKNKMNLILSKIADNFQNLYFDEPFSRNTNINSIEDFLSKPEFFYCGELIYAVYQFVIGNSDFIYNDGYIPIETMVKNRGVPITPIEKVFVDYASQLEMKEKNYLINQRNFYLSKDFSPIALYGSNKSLKESYNKKN
ncbi:MAG: hypothetical protein ACD_79C01333G0002 [uncultured bacterium]|nr:MAG: hypothetical protein ACD_79C01333G0002 [uncultured bacterium]